MRTETFIRPSAALAAAVLAAGLAVAQKKDAPPQPPLLTPLVRLDLLAAQAKAVESAAPLRDLFSPGRAAAPEAFEPPEEPGAGEEPGVEEPGGAEAAPAAPSLDASYIGFVRSDRGIVALVVTGGQAVAVAVGEEIVPGQKVERIAPDRIEVVGADGKRTSVPIQGEQP